MESRWASVMASASAGVAGRIWKSSKSPLATSIASSDTIVPSGFAVVFSFFEKTCENGNHASTSFTATSATARRSRPASAIKTNAEASSLAVNRRAMSRVGPTFPEVDVDCHAGYRGEEQCDAYILRNDVAADRWELTWFHRINGASPPTPQNPDDPR